MAFDDFAKQFSHLDLVHIGKDHFYKVDVEICDRIYVCKITFCSTFLFDSAKYLLAIFIKIYKFSQLNLYAKYI